MRFTGVFTMWMLAAHICQDSATKRTKRVFLGDDIPDREGPAYAFIFFFTWFGFTQFDLLKSQKMERQDQVCGGALITKDVAQSACHCFSYFQAPNNDGVSWHKRNDKTMNVVVGKSAVDPDAKLIQIERYVNHMYCRKVGPWVANDFALLLLAEDVSLPGGPRPNIALAPVYPLTELAAMWKRFTSRQQVCAMVGFGLHITGDDETKSSVLRHAWMKLRSYRDCYRNTPVDEGGIAKWQEVNTWSCLFPFRQGIGGRGDSGSPITCDNKYFALFIQGYGVVSDLVFYAYANSLEYRRAMLSDIHDSSKDPVHQQISVRPDELMHPDPAPPH